EAALGGGQDLAPARRDVLLRDLWHSTSILALTANGRFSITNEASFSFVEVRHVTLNHASQPLEDPRRAVAVARDHRARQHGHERPRAGRPGAGRRLRLDVAVDR